MSAFAPKSLLHHRRSECTLFPILWENNVLLVQKVLVE
jgi:hypothetical protein